MNDLRRILVGCVLALAAEGAWACGIEATAIGAGKMRQFSPSQHPLPAKIYSEVEYQFNVAPDGDECMLGIGFGTISHPPPDSLLIEEATLVRVGEAEPRAKSVVLPFVAQSRGVLLAGGPGVLVGPAWFGFNGTFSTLTHPLQPGEVFAVRFLLSVDAAEADRVPILPVQFAAGPTLPDGSPDFGVGGPNPFRYSPATSLAKCLPTQLAHCLMDGRFAVDTAWRTRDAQGAGEVDPYATDLAGTFSFFEASNVELTIKILDGRPLNGHCWVFHSGMTNVEYTLTVTDTQTGAVKRYTNPQGRPAVSVLDTLAFECG